MLRSTTLIIASFAALGLASCASVPQQTQLLSGIDSAKISQSVSTKRSPTDAVCVDFYNNVNSFYQQAQKNQGTKNFFSTLGINVLASVATAGLVPTGIGTVGRVAAVSAASSVTSQGSRIALRQLNSSDKADAKIIETADQIGCPVSVTP